MKPLLIDNYTKDERNIKFAKFLETVSEKRKELMQYLFNILKLYKMDSGSFYACGYFVAIPKEEVDYNFIKTEYGEDVSKMLKKLNEVGFYTSEEADLEYVRNMFISMAQDLRVMIILLAYNMHRAEHIFELPGEEQVIFARMVRDIYAPLSARLGLRDIKNKLEDISFKYFDPDMYKQLSLDDRLNKKERQNQIAKTIDKIKLGLEELKIKGEVYGREKHLASVYNKLKEKKTTLSQIYDLMAVRVIVTTVEECYLVLGKINSIFTIIPNRFKDYIATPKPNGYQSIHTGILSENNRPIEVQIRTKEMHQFNEYGVAAHWIYKDKGHKRSNTDETISWLKGMIDENKDLSSKEFVETISRNMFSNEIFAQTPNGKVIKFPSGANCIDFAYAIHTTIGNRCVGAKINGKIVPITTALQNGDVCEIILGPNNKAPSRDWLNVVKTNGARAKINAYFKKQFVEENIKNGKNALEFCAKNNNSTLSEILKSNKLSEVLRKYNLNNTDELFSLVGNGNLKADGIVSRLLPHKSNIEIKYYNDNKKKQSKSSILVSKQRDMMTRFAKCCMPVVGDEIVGYVSLNSGVTIHRNDCLNVKNMDKDRFIDVEWDEGATEEYQVRLKVYFKDKASLSKIAEILEKLNIKVVSFELNSTNNKELLMVIVVKNHQDIDKVKSRIESLSNVEECKRG